MSSRRYFTAAASDKVVVDREPLISVEDACAHLSLINRRAVYRLVRQGMPCHRAGQLLRFKRSELEAWTRRHREG